MKFSFLSHFLLIRITKILVFLIAAATTQAIDDAFYKECNESYVCGSGTVNIKYPFYRKGHASYCGLRGYEVYCDKENIGYPVFNINSQPFNVLHINRSAYTMTIARVDLFVNLCPSEFVDTTINYNLVTYAPGVENLTLFYSCDSKIFDNRELKKLECKGKNGSVALEKAPPDRDWSEASLGCEENVTVPVMQKNWDIFKKETLVLLDVVNKGFEVSYDLQGKMELCRICESSEGICGTNDTTTSVFTCFCKDGPHANSCREGEKRNTGRVIGIVFAALGGFLLIAALVVSVFVFRYKRGNPMSSLLESRNISPYESSVLDLEKSSFYYGAVQVFEYNDLQEATNNFDENKELGDGGFGIVYQGKLRDGRVVAVKRLYERNFNRVEQFMNEVKILTGLRHPNLVTLYGCTSRNCRELLLVYEYVSNGTVADHLHGERAKPGSLSWTTRMSIAVETADALSYLHNSDVIHRDVKTNNILLDNNFGVKVADFGLSRLYPNNVTHVSTAPQGTPGYVDPEYHQCYRLTDKSDVYSFGVVLIELISSLPAVDITRHRHDINLSNMAMDKIQNHALHEIVDPYLGFDSDTKVREMVNGVAELAFRCLQNEKDMRPSMEEVWETLKRINSEDHSPNIIEEIETPGGDVSLKSEPPAVSPDSTTPNTSG